MPFNTIIIILLISPLLISLSALRLEAHITEEIPSLQLDQKDLQKNALLKDPLPSFQEIHHFESVFDNPHLGGIPYEPFE